MSRIDELQRLHEAATKNSNLPWIWVDRDRAWPAIHRVLVAARILQNVRTTKGGCGWTANTEKAAMGVVEALRALEKQP